MLERMRAAVKNFPCSVDGVHNDNDVKIADDGLYFIFSFYFILFFFYFSFLNFLFLEQLGLGLSVTLSHQSQIDGKVTRLIMGLGRMK